jgi:hypothetical protein
MWAAGIQLVKCSSSSSDPAVNRNYITRLAQKVPYRIVVL